MAVKTDVIFTGLFRNPELLKKSINNLIEIRKNGLINKIIFSTWDYEIEKNKEIISFLAENKVKIIVNIEPENRGIGNIFCQMKALEEGLKNAGKNSFVLKTRSDLYIDKTFLEDLFRKKEEILSIKRELPKGNVFSYKVWIPYFEITSPFHMADECFYGFREDISKLVNFNDYYKELSLRAGVAHIQRHVHPFIEKYNEIKDFFKNNSNVGFPKDESSFYKMLKKISRENKILINALDGLTVKRRFKILNKRFSDDFYLNALAAYYSILYSHFYVNNGPINNEYNNQGIFNRNSNPEKTLEDAEIIKNFEKNKISVMTKGQIYSFNEVFLKNIFENRKEQENSFGKELLRRIDEFAKINS